MPILINEVIAEVESSDAEPATAGSDINTVPLTTAEQELLKTLQLLQLRQARLRID